MKLYNVLVCILAVVTVAYAATDTVRNERLLRGIRDAKAVHQQQYDNAILVDKAQDYTRPLVRSVESLSKENGALLERELQAAKVVGGLMEESNRLKVSLKEAVIKLQELNNENNKALEEINQLQFKVKTLQSALDAIAKAKEVQVPPKELSVPTPQVPVVPPAPPKKALKIRTNPSKIA